MSTLHSVDPGALQTLTVNVLGNETHIALSDPRHGGGSIHVSTAELFAALGLHEEWGVRYEIPDPAPLQDPIRTIAMPNRAHADAAIQSGAPIRARNRRRVHRHLTEWSEA